MEIDLVNSVSGIDSAEFQRNMAYYECAIMEVETKFNVLNREFSLKHDRQPISSIKSRLKSPSSILEKLQRNALPISMDSINESIEDVAGLRITCSFLSDVYLLADALSAQDDIEVLKIKDYIQNPKPNGYRSLHMIVSVPIFLEQEKRPMRVEIQFRTIAMDFWASLEHQLRYKKAQPFTKDMDQSLCICAELSAELDARMDTLRQQVFEVGE